MTSINSKMGLKAAGKRSMMKLPDDKTLRNRITAAVCPKCGRRGAALSRLVKDPVSVNCTWCHETWPLDPPEATS